MTHAAARRGEARSAMTKQKSETKIPGGVSVDLFCGVEKLLRKQYGPKLADPAGMNDFVRSLAHVEAAYRRLADASMKSVRSSTRKAKRHEQEKKD
jgi:hypothetical protein